PWTPTTSGTASIIRTTASPSTTWTAGCCRPILSMPPLDPPHGDGDTPRPDDPTLAEALAGFHTVVDNALHSTDWEHACLNLAISASALAAFTNSVEDERHELCNENDLLSSEIRCYMENVARYADSATASIALGEITKAAYEPELQFYDPVNAAMLLASATAFARHGDKTMWAYDVVDTALERFGEHHDTDLPHEALVASRRVLRRYMLMVAYDVRRLAGDDEGCAALWREHPDMAPLTLMRVVTLFNARRFREARETVEAFLATVTDRAQADAHIMHNGLLPELLPHGWRTLLECCAEGMGDSARLADLYRDYIIRGNDKRDAAYVNRLRRLLSTERPGDVDDADDARWHDEARRLARRCARDIAERITSRPEMTTVDDGYRAVRRSSWRNPAYEKLIVDERLTDDALTYCVTIVYPPLPLLKTMAIGHPDKARETILEAMPQGALSEDDVMRLLHADAADLSRPSGAGRAPKAGASRPGMARLSATRAVYRQIAKQLRRYADVFDTDSARLVADLIIRRYPNRPALREELAFIRG
ncbi:SWIM zinc finger protein, partial [Bifidobacterium parmae]